MMTVSSSITMASVLAFFDILSASRSESAFLFSPVAGAGSSGGGGGATRVLNSREPTSSNASMSL